MSEARLRRQYLPVIRRLGGHCITKAGINPSLLLHDGDVRVFFAPFNTTEQCTAALRKACILFIGLTPGMVQVRRAFDDFFMPSVDDSVSFAGTMRKNLCRYLDSLHLAKHLPGIGSANDLFGGDAKHLATSTSLLRYPVFKHNGGNYGGTANLARHPFLLEMAIDLLLPVLGAAPARVLVVPLGKAVERGLEAVPKSPKLKATILHGFPHPSGLNVHGPKQFNANRPDLARQLKRFAAANW